MEATQHVTTTIAPSDVRADLDPSFVTPEHSENEYDDLLARAKGPEIAQVSAHQQHDFTAQQFSRFYQYIESHPEAIPGPVLAAIGEALILDLANEASIRGRGQLDMFIKDNPQVFLFINTYIDRIGIAFGKRWVADKDINRVIAELKIAQHESKSRPILKRLWDAACNNDTTGVSSLSEEVETLFAQRVALQGEVAQLTTKKALLLSEILRTTQEQQLRLLQEHRSMVSEQIERQDAVAKELRTMQEEISRLQQRRHSEIESHLEKIRQIKEDTRALLSARDIARTEYRQARGESEVLLPSDSEKQRFVSGATIALAKLFYKGNSSLSLYSNMFENNTKNFLLVATLFSEIEQKAPESLPAVFKECLTICALNVEELWSPIFSDVLMGRYTMNAWLEEKRVILETLVGIQKDQSDGFLWPGVKSTIDKNEFTKMYDQAVVMLFLPIDNNTAQL